ncbi:MAG: ABC transporter ATP-binding protein [Lachnospiraceae bacterium]|nr:ABC transporter ATP-binding protein [Lachnospiraceae bacterium]
MAFLEIENLSYKYGHGDLVIKNMNFSFEAGKIYALLGASGAGKTTLLSLLAGLDNPVEGKILHNGVELKKINRDRYRAKYIGMVFQQFNLLHRFNAIDNIIMAMEISKYKVENRKQYAINLLESLGIDEKKRHRKVIELSGGEQQRVAIARALSHKPEIILADEPTGSLDEANQAGIIEILVKSAKEDNRCIIISTHSRDVAGVADKIIAIERIPYINK